MRRRRGASSLDRNNRSVQGGSEERKRLSAKDDVSFAHISKDGRKHLLCDHLTGTAKLAADFASEFGSREWGQINTIVTVKWL